MAFIGLKTMSRKGVAMTEKPNPILVCKKDNGNKYENCHSDAAF